MLREVEGGGGPAMPPPMMTTSVSGMLTSGCFGCSLSGKETFYLPAPAVPQLTPVRDRVF